MARNAWAAAVALSVWIGTSCAAINTPTVCGVDCFANSSSKSVNTFCANAWNQDGTGFQCLTVREDQQSFDATWKWSSDAGGATVHSYPFIRLGSADLPVQFQNISSINVTAKWFMGPGSSSASSLDADGLARENVIANVAFDLWADMDPVTAANASAAGIEIMIWLGEFGNAHPLGWNKNTTCWKQKLGNAEFTLYTGHGPRNQTVLTWLADSNQTQISGDISPLVQYLWRNKLMPQDAYVGSVEFGTEAFHSSDNVTFSAEAVTLDITKGVPPTLTFDSTPTECPSAGWRQGPKWSLIVAALALPSLLL